MMAETPVRQHPLLQTLLLFSIGALLLWLSAIIFYPIIFTLLVSMLFYAAMFPATGYLIRRDVSPSLAVMLAMTAIVAVMLVIVMFLYPVVATQLTQLSSRTDHLDARMSGMLVHLNIFTGQYLDFSFDPAAVTATLIDGVSSKLAGLEQTVSSYFDEVAFSLVLVPLTTFFLLRDFRGLRNAAMQLLPNRYFELGWLIFNAASSQLQRYLKGISIQLVTVTLICMIGFWLAGIDFAPLLAVLTGLLNLIPVFGIALAKIPPVIVVLLSDSPDLLSVLLALGVVFLAQIVDTVWILPKVIAKSANLHPLTVILSVTLAGYYFGFAALIAVVPLLFSAKVIFLELYRGLRDFHPTQQQRMLSRLRQRMLHRF